MRILVVEDESKMRGLLVDGLEQLGFQPVAVGDGEAALAATRRERFDAIVLDVMLPGLDGFEVLRVLRARQDLTPVVMLTARDAIPDRVHGLDSGADDYLVKPFAFTELASRLRAVTRRKSEPAADHELRCGPLRLDPDTRLVRVSGEVVELTAREFDLLEVLMRSPGRVFTRPGLIEQVWGYSYDGHSNVVDVYIGYLRHKIDRPYGLAMLETVRGVGYRLVDPDRP